MVFKEKAQAAAQEILTAFEQGLIPQALAQVFIHRNHDVPARRWSFSNRLIAALHGHHDARGFRQWKAAGRYVKAGEHAFHILVPHKITAKEDDEERGIKAGDTMVIGFLSAAVFGYSQTDGEPLPGEEEEAHFIESLPLVEVARSWGIEVVTYSGSGAGALGYFAPGQIALGVRNPSTWAHEMIHYAASWIMPTRAVIGTLDRAKVVRGVGIIDLSLSMPVLAGASARCRAWVRALCARTRVP